jgi:pyruvate kinase
VLYYSLNYRKPDWKEKQVVESISYTAVKMADYVDATAISAITHSGSTARRIAKFRPKVPIIGFTESEVVRHQLALVWGVTSMGVNELFGTDESIILMEKYLLEEQVVSVGDRVIFCSGLPVSERGRTNTIMVDTIKAAN